MIEWNKSLKYIWIDFRISLSRIIKCIRNYKQNYISSIAHKYTFEIAHVKAEAEIFSFSLLLALFEFLVILLHVLSLFSSFFCILLGLRSYLSSIIRTKNRNIFGLFLPFSHILNGIKEFNVYKLHLNKIQHKLKSVVSSVHLCMHGICGCGCVCVHNL